MMSEAKKRGPKRRFKEFLNAGDWEQRKLLTVLNKIVDYRGRTPKKLGLDWSPSGHLALSALNVKMGYIDKTVDAHYGDDHLYSVWMKDNDLYEGQVLFTTEAPMGNVAQVPDDNKYILSQRTIAFVPDRSVISDNFLAVVLSASKCQKSLINRASGGTAKGVSQKTLSEISLDIPQSLSEQDKVSELIKKLSKIITLHQRKLDKLQATKKALLQEMFPEEGQDKPKRRFKGFADTWEQRKLGDLAEIVRGASPRPISDPKWFDNNSNVGWLRIADVTAQDGRIRYLEQKISELGQEKTRVIKTPHLLLSIAATVGKPVINYVPTGVHDGFLIFLNPKFNILYTFWWLEMFREKWNKYGQPGSQVNLNSDLVKNQVINIPNEKEQEKISSFLEALDKIITLHQRKLDKLKNLKQAYLNEMFV